MQTPLVQAVPLDLCILGIDQVEYTVGDATGKTFAYAAGKASIARAVSIEKGIAAYADLVRLEQKKIEDLNDALVAYASAYAKFQGDIEYHEVAISLTSSEKAALNNVCNVYGISRHDWDGGDKISAGDLDYIKADVDYAVQSADSDMKEDTASLQSYIAKRDSAFSTASTLQSKADGSVSAQLKYMVG